MIDRPCVGCGKEHNCYEICSRFYLYLDSIEQEPKPVLTKEEKKMDKFHKYNGLKRKNKNWFYARREVF